MKLTISKNNLLNSINIVSKAVPNKTTMSILECIMIDATGSDIVMIANDMELGIQTYVEGEIEEHGKIAVNASIFSNIVRKLPDNDVFIKTEGEKITITCEKAKFSILGKKGDDFTYLPEVERNDGIRVSQYTLKNIINKTIFSISSNESNGMMTGELLEVTEGSLRMVALDGHRIAIRRVALQEGMKEKKVIIAGKTLNEISKILLGDTERFVDIYVTDKHVLFMFDRTIVVSRLIEGNYYSIDSMLTNQYTATATVKRQELLNCLDRATLLVKEDDKKPIIMMISDSSMELKINTTIGSMDEIIDIEKTGENMNIGFNPKFIIDALRAIDDEMVTLYLVSPKAPCFIRNDIGKDADEMNNYCYLILPVNFITVD